MTIRAVFFDLDDTLCDTIGTREARARRVFGLLWPEMGNFDGEAFVARVLEPIEGDRAVRGLRAVLEELGIGGTPAGLRAMRMWSFAGCEELLKTFEGVSDTVQELSREYAVGVITNWNGEDEQRHKLRHLGLETFIRHLIVSSVVGFEKPDPRIFGHALSLAGVTAQDAVFVGDRLDVDIGGAHVAGMRAVWFNHWGGTLEGRGVRPDAVIERFCELPEALRTMVGRD